MINGFTGDPGGKLAQQADLVVRVPSPELGHQEDGHLIINHVVCTRLPSVCAQSEWARMFRRHCRL